MDRLLSFMIVTELQNITVCFDRQITKEKSWQDVLIAINDNIDNLEGKITGLLIYQSIII